MEQWKERGGGGGSSGEKEGWEHRGLRPGEVTSVPLFTVSKTTRETADTSYKSRVIDVRSGARGCLRWWEGPSQSHWSAIARLKLGSPRPVSFHSADCDTDHSLVSTKVRIQPKCIHRSKQKGRPRINTARTVMPDLCERFACSIEEALMDCPTSSAEERWHYIRDAKHTSAMDTFGKRERQNPDWFEAGIAELEPALSAKRAALLDYKREPSEKTLAAFRNARNDAQRIVMLKTNLAGTVGLSEIHSVMPEVKELATCQGASMLEAAKRVFPQARGMLRAPSMMRLPTEVCRNFLPETCSLGVRQACTFASSKYRSLDGSCNNLNHAKRGAAMTNYKRLLPPAYDDDLDSMRGGDGRLPQPRRLSAALQALGPDRNRNQKPLSHLFMQWGQFVAHDLAFTALSQPKDCCKGHRLKPRTPTEGCQAMNVTDDPVFSAARRTCFFFVRSLVGGKECELGPRQQVNQMSHYLDASGVYGAGDRESRNLRTMSSGKLKVSMPQPGVLPLLPDNGNSFLAVLPACVFWKQEGTAR
ncbi:hypothetical protein Pcinc_006210 [Petrolisthes cinctipes]|uniref:Peroxidase n=1 Tax=Petrolisthes cinctipes TaxID=88211 RepID=A0AAE1GB42_PETCI|nr:hypothetical protein Pcinc_006210 [Petrolisthes cinctipes]